MRNYDIFNLDILKFQPEYVGNDNALIEKVTHVVRGIQLRLQNEKQQELMQAKQRIAATQAAQLAMAAAAANNNMGR